MSFNNQPESTQKEKFHAKKEEKGLDIGAKSFVTAIGIIFILMVLSCNK